MAGAGRVLAVAAAAILVVCCGVRAWDEGRDHFLQSFGDAQLGLGVRVNVLLVGLSSEGEAGANLDPVELEELLGTMFVAHSPTCMHSRTALNIRYDVSYRVKHASQHQYSALIEAMRTGMQSAGSRLVPGALTNTSATTYDVDAAAVGRLLAAWKDDFASDDFEQGVLPSSQHFIAILNPSKRLLSDDTQFSYRWVFDGGVPTQSFFTPEGHVAIDLAAGPVSFGRMGAAEGAVSDMSFPRADDYFGAGAERRVRALLRALDDDEGDDEEDEGEGDDRDLGGVGLEEMAQMGGPAMDRLPSEQQASLLTEFKSRLAAAVVDCTRHAFVTDPMFDLVDMSDKLVVPIIVLRNHHAFNPLKEADQSRGTQHSRFVLDKEAIEEAVRKLAKPNQHVTFLTVMHDMHDHPQISMAVRKAMRSDTTHEMRQGKYQPVTRQFLDSKVLEEEMLEASDLLTAGLMSMGAQTGDDFFDHTTSWVGSQVPTFHGTRILPVYVFSLIGLEQDLLMDNMELMRATPHCVLVLQTHDPRTRIPYYQGADSVHVDARSPTRLILSGLAQSLGAIAPLYQRFSREHNAITNDYRWAAGAHVFGPFSKTASLPLSFSHTALQNLVMSHVHSVVATGKHIAQLSEDFAEDFMLDPGGEDIHHTAPDMWLVGRLFHQPDQSSVLPVALVASLHDKMESLEDALVDVVTLLSAGDANQALSRAKDAVIAASLFHQYVTEELTKAETALLCCNIVHSQQDSMVWDRLLLLGLVGLVVFVVVQGVGPSSPAPRQRSRFDRR